MRKSKEATLKNSFSAFVITFAMGLFYAAVASWVALAATAIFGGWMPSLMFAIFFVGVNCAFALLEGVFAGMDPLRRCWATLPAPIVLVVVYRAVTGTTSFVLYFTALSMFSFFFIGVLFALIIRLVKGYH